MSNKMFIAVELNDDGSVNHMGTIAPTKEKAWDAVHMTFIPSETQIWELIPRYDVKAPTKVTFIKLGKEYEWDGVG